MSASGAAGARGWWALRWRIAALAAMAWFLSLIAEFYRPDTGFSSLISIGDLLNDTKVTALRQVPHYVYEDSAGYDGGYYVQLALSPLLDNPELLKAIDNPHYRAKRMLCYWAAWLLGLGRPEWIVQAQALLNVGCWLALACLLWRWFPPDSAENFLRWGGVMFSHGVCMSVRHSLVDAPGLLLVALAMRGVEDGRRTRGTAMLALAGLTKETSLLAATGVADIDWKAPSTWWRPALTAVAAAAPLLLWMGYVRWKFGPAQDPGLGNFGPPLAGLAEKWGDALGYLAVRGDSTMRWATVAVVFALTVQGFFFALRRRPANAWWRIGAVFAVLMVFVSTPVWEGVPGAATRVLLPMTLAFNVLVPRGRKWLALLIAGNLTVFAAYWEFTPPPREFYRIAGASETRMAVRVEVADGWYGPETFRGESWRWSPGRAELRIHNDTGGPLAVTLRGRATGLDERTLRIFAGDAMVWSRTIDRNSAAFAFGCMVPEGGAVIRFESDKAWLRIGADPRRLSFRIFDLEVVVKPAGGQR